MMLRPVTSEKAVKLIDVENTLLFEVDRRAAKPEIKKEIESLFSVKISDIRTHIRNNKKYAYVRLAKANPAIDVATKLGMI
ncbi:MAG TPA: 50S ribosomal protein L23 [Candidatus Nanoarchaeia archaeon]|nr:50S ribosomal protein L23 [Candidatus Nanoarchaeia archaeon]